MAQKSILGSLILATLILCGCSTTPIAPAPIVVTEPVPSAASVPAPYLPIDHITKDSTDDDVVKAYAESIVILKVEVKDLRIALKPYQAVKN